MMALQKILLAPALVALVAAVPATVNAQEARRLPRLGFSIAEPSPENNVDGPLFQRAKASFAAAQQSDSAYRKFLKVDADAQLSSSPGAAGRVPFTAATIRAASESCLGPYPFDEGLDWVQLSWICRVDGVGPLASIMTFRDSPELSLTIWFDGGLISKISAMEPLWIPMRRRPAMDAYAVMQKDR
jgi:hypothetical protein